MHDKPYDIYSDVLCMKGDSDVQTLGISRTTRYTVAVYCKCDTPVGVCLLTD